MIQSDIAFNYTHTRYSPVIRSDKVVDVPPGENGVDGGGTPVLTMAAQRKEYLSKSKHSHSNCSS